MKDVKLYNVLFPIWMLMLIPSLWLVVLPGNFLIDSLVLLIFMHWVKLEQRKVFYKKHIFAIYGFGLLADVVGSAWLFVCAYVLELGTMGDELYLTIPAVVISAVCIFLLNYFVTFRKQDKALRKKLALTFAIATAPYTFMIPTGWIYGF